MTIPVSHKQLVVTKAHRQHLPSMNCIVVRSNELEIGRKCEIKSPAISFTKRPNKAETNTF